MSSFKFTFKEIVKDSKVFKNEDIDKIVSILTECGYRPKNLEFLRPQLIPSEIGTIEQREAIIESARRFFNFPQKQVSKNLFTSCFPKK